MFATRNMQPVFYATLNMPRHTDTFSMFSSNYVFLSHLSTTGMSYTEFSESLPDKPFFHD